MRSMLASRAAAVAAADKGGARKREVVFVAVGVVVVPATLPAPGRVVVAPFDERAAEEAPAAEGGGWGRAA